MKLSMFVITLLSAIILLSGCVLKDKNDSDMDWPKLPSYGKCNTDADCIIVSCQNYGSVITHKNALNHLDEIKEKMCDGKADPTVSYEGVECRTSGLCQFKDPYPKPNFIDNSNLTKPTLPPDAQKPFSDD
ncbi:MAG TPA: hypothetical protein VI564_02165 [Candidatus Nanoarchaeia archaeon]|nr:hypothetical protein [Candidatus Nanoarchaeia archaeon]